MWTGKGVGEIEKKLLLSTALKKLVGLHGSFAMCLPVPAIKQGEKLELRCDLGCVEKVNRGRLRFNCLDERAQRFALGRYNGALPRTPAIFRLRQPRFAGQCVFLLS